MEAGAAGGAAGAAAPAAPAAPAARLQALDLMRGLIMVVMAWDHTKDIFADKAWMPKHRGSEMWEGPFSSYDDDWWWFIARAVSNVCAPGFFVTMGMSMALLTVARLGQGWTRAKVAHHFFVRGAILLAVGRLVDPPFLLGPFVQVLKGMTVENFHGVYSPDHPFAIVKDFFVGIFEVMTGLGLVMMTATVVLFPAYELYLWQTESEDRTSAAAQASLEAPLLEAQTDASSDAHVPLHQTGPGSATSRSSPIKDALRRASLRMASAKSNISLPELFVYPVFIAVYAWSNIAIVQAQGDDFYLNRNTTFPDAGYRASNAWQVLGRFFVYPGFLPSPLGVTSYPVIPWLAMTSFGIGLGFSLKRNADGTIRRLGRMGVLFLACFVLVRLFGGPVGNYRGLPRGDGQRDTDEVRVDKLLAFFITCKYPPSLAFFLLYVGIDLVVIYAFFRSQAIFPIASPRSWPSRTAQFLWDTCLIFGQVPLFFYVLHFWILGPVSAFVAAVTPDSQYKVSLPACVLIWLALLSMLRPACQRYGVFKRSTPKDSLWRYI